MSDLHSTPSIRIAFPHVPEEYFAGETANEPVTSLFTSPGAADFFDRLAEWMLRQPSTCVGYMLPGLWLARDESIKQDQLPVRVIGALERLSISVWGEILEFTPSFLLDLRGFGEGSLRPFLAVAAATSARACCNQAPPTRLPTVNLFEPRCFPPRANFMTSQLRRLMEWAANEHQAHTVGDFLAACSDINPPEDIKLLCEALRATDLSDVFSNFIYKESICALVGDLCGVLNSRSLKIFLSRISLNNVRTLEDLGNEFSLTRERVRQLWVRAEQRVREAIVTPRFAPVLWRAHTLRSMLGMAVPADAPLLEEAFEHVARGVTIEGRERVLDILLWLGGPYRWSPDTGWLQSADIPNHSVIETYSDEYGRVDMRRLQEHLTGSGMLEKVQTFWLDRIGKIKCVGDTWLLWTGTVPDKAVRLLEIWGEPATPEALVDAIGEGHDVRATRSRLFDDERVMRVDMTRVGLRSWGMEEYSSIAEEIDQELERRGGAADLTDLIATLVTRFNLRESSVKFYVGAPMFVLDGKTLRRRTSADPRPPIRPVTESPGCYLLSPDCLSWRLEVNADMLRGSGRPLAIAIAGWLGVGPGGNRVLIGSGGTVRISWLETSTAGPALGSTRFLAVAVGAQIGDQVLLRFDRTEGSISMTRIDQEAVSATYGFKRLSLLTGIPLNDGDVSFRHALGIALGTQGTQPAIAAEFRRRGEDELAGLVPPDAASPDLDAAIDAMADLF